MPQHYKLLTPGPLTTSLTVKQAMLQDWCTWDDDYNSIVQAIRRTLIELAEANTDSYTSVLMQGSGTFSVEAAIGTILPSDATLLVLANGAYGKRIATIAEYLKINCIVHDFGETKPIDPIKAKQLLQENVNVTHVAFVHCETTTGMLNPVDEIVPVIKSMNKVCILDAMSSFGGIPISVEELDIDVLISSANKCIQGVPGFGFIILKRAIISECKGRARSLSLDLYDQWETMEKYNGKWRYTSATHTVRAFSQALSELKSEGGIHIRHKRYHENQKLLVSGMREIGYKTLLPDEYHSPIITTFLSPADSRFEFRKFYDALKEHGFVIYPGKVTDYDCFRVGNIGEIYKDDIINLIKAVENVSGDYQLGT